MRSTGAALVCAAFFLLSACTDFNVRGFPVSQRGLKAWGIERGLVSLTFPSEALSPSLALVRRSADDEAILYIYIEGDGAAWPSPFHPPADPTPNIPVALLLAEAQPGGNVVYLPRPCQYETSPHCSPHLWTTGRYSRPVIDGFQKTLDDLRSYFAGFQFVLIGYSGGGLIAVQLLASREDIAKVITIASPLDVSAWISYHESEGSLILDPPMPPRSDAKWSKVFQVLGTDDEIVPLSSSFQTPFSPRILTVPEADHTCCWVRNWPFLFLKLKDENDTCNSEEIC